MLQISALESIDMKLYFPEMGMYSETEKSNSGEVNYSYTDGYVSPNDGFLKISPKSIEIFPRTDSIKITHRHHLHQLKIFSTSNALSCYSIGVWPGQEVSLEIKLC